jgi:DNA helicase-2/ATP-dependent DNA helicase PcrA
VSTSSLGIALEQLTDIQRQAVDWGDGPLLVIAGPGSGKTQVLTARIARLLDTSRDQKFRLLALTFTNKAADEMKARVASFVPGLEERAYIGTFHSFSALVLRQHGVHLGINPDFAIYSSTSDREAVLQDALDRSGPAPELRGETDARFLPVIDRLKEEFIQPSDAEAELSHLDDAQRIAIAYRLYEEELRRINAMDFNSLLFEAYRLMTQFPAIAARYRRSYPFWLIDEFQDTNIAQYRLLQSMSGGEFKNVFSVADDDQIIYEWNGASYKQIQAFLADFAAPSIQLPTNYRCPPAIVDAANRLVVYNSKRTAAKQPLAAGKLSMRYPASEHLQVRVFDTDEEEAAGVAREIADRGTLTWASTAVLARTRYLLDGVNRALHANGVSSVIAQRRDEFLSPEFRWFAAALKQVARPLDRRNLGIVVEAFNRLAGCSVSVDEVISDSETTGKGYLATWIGLAEGEGSRISLLGFLTPCATDPIAVRGAVDAIVGEFEQEVANRDADSDLREDLRAWRELSRDIASQVGKQASLDEFLQELQLRSKEPSHRPNTVSLMTVHGAKGREFDFVHVIGLAEDVMPSFQSRKKGDATPEMEEERRNCFVAITRTKECLVLSHAKQYRGWPKEPSRFLIEMGLVAHDKGA